MQLLASPRSRLLHFRSRETFCRGGSAGRGWSKLTFWPCKHASVATDINPPRIVGTSTLSECLNDIMHVQQHPW